MFSRKSLKVFIIFAIISIALFNISVAPVFAKHGADPLKILSINIGCYPDHAPNDGGCGLPHFIKLIDGAINFLLNVVVLPVALLMIIWAAFVIITAGGSKEKVSKGKKIITVAIIGLVIAFLARAAVGLIYNLIRGGSPPI
jgi:hypothetical protein